MRYFKDPQGKGYVLGIKYPEFERDIYRGGYFYIGPWTKAYISHDNENRLEAEKEMPVYPTILAQRILMSTGNYISSRINRLVNSSRLLRFLFGKNPLPRFEYYIMEEKETERTRGLPSVYRSRRLDRLSSSLYFE